jgi:hypothetical protein
MRATRTLGEHLSNYRDLKRACDGASTTQSTFAHCKAGYIAKGGRLLSLGQARGRGREVVNEVREEDIESTQSESKVSGTLVNPSYRSPRI